MTCVGTLWRVLIVGAARRMLTVTCTADWPPERAGRGLRRLPGLKNFESLWFFRPGALLDLTFRFLEFQICLVNAARSRSFLSPRGPLFADPEHGYFARFFFSQRS